MMKKLFVIDSEEDREPPVPEENHQNVVKIVIWLEFIFVNFI